MFLQWKLTLQKPKTIRNLIIAIAGISVIAFLLNTAFGNTCGIQHFNLISDIETFEKTLNPEFCEVVVENILTFNEQCDADIEILDCG
jgi:hypothetical protein